jgi:hypothetical protein
MAEERDAVNKAFPSSGRAVHFPVMLYFVLLSSYVTLVFATGASATSTTCTAERVGSIGPAWIFVASIVLIAAVDLGRPGPGPTETTGTVSAR